MSNLETNSKIIMPSVDKPWMKHFPEESLNKEMKYCTVYEQLKEVAENNPDAKALYFYGTRWSYKDLLKKIHELANAFTALGVREGEIVSFLLPTTPESICCFYAINKIGAVPNFIDPRMDAQRILDAAGGVDSRFFVSIDAMFGKVMSIRDRLCAEKIIVSNVSYSLSPVMKALYSLKGGKTVIPEDKDIIKWDAFLAMGKGVSSPTVTFKENSVAAITYTGGTTGTPKGVLLTNDGLNTMADSFLLYGVDKGENDRFLAIMPIFTSYGVGCGVHMPLSEGCELYVIPQFTPNELGKLIKKYKPNHMMATPAFYEQIMISKALKHQNLSFLISTGCGGDTMNPGLEDRFNKFLKDRGAKYPISQGYGMSEMSGAVTCCQNTVYKDGSSGIPLIAVTVAAFDPVSGEELPCGVEGELCMTGRSMMLGYFKNQAETDNVIRVHKDGKKWVHSGDIGYVDEDGYVFIKGRIKQIIIKFDGHKVFPITIESMIGKNNPDVVGCAVVGIPDPDHGQGDVPLAVVKLREGSSYASNEEARADIMALCERLCEERGKPYDVVITDELSLTGFGKHDYKKIGEMYKDYKKQ